MKVAMMNEDGDVSHGGLLGWGFGGWLGGMREILRLRVVGGNGV